MVIYCALYGSTANDKKRSFFRFSKDEKSYVNYSNIAARVLRRSLKSNLKDDAAKRDQTFIKIFFWANGDILPAGEKPPPEKGKT
ncbi:uncharacterized protein isoform X2 [Choristoneura fumiferana]|uniref:uncharacterized protein isoform X2 n=1 Tax=Choristoneura fumiferana TaxID=7141 RepID=UPI003D158BA0